MKKVRAFVMIMVFSVALYACSSTIVGKYVYEKDSRAWVELQADGTYLATEGGPITKGTYTVDGNAIKISWKKGNDTEVRYASINGNTLSFSDTDGSGSLQIIRFTKQAPSASSSSIGQPSADPGKLTTAKAQSALETWVRTKNGGTVEVIGIQDLPQENAAKADIKFTKLDFARGESHYSGPGVAIFTHYNDGRWVLSRVQTSESYNSRIWDSLSIEAR